MVEHIKSGQFIADAGTDEFAVKNLLYQLVYQEDIYSSAFDGSYDMMRMNLEIVGIEDFQDPFELAYINASARWSNTLSQVRNQEIEN